MPIAVLLAAAIAAPAAVVSTASSPDAPVELFFGKLKAGDAAEAYRAIWAGTLIDRKPGAVQVMSDQTAMVIKYFGPIVGWELLHEGPASPHFRERCYILRTEGGPVFFKFQLYDNGAKWVVTKLTFNDDHDKLQTTPQAQ
ncbi:hypothetical protein [Phenylobacterium sp.]|uniref:hypothetical protein n=1 Tax=Phenylobacterium sp. TaxID=1871053 RepID=UPI0027324D9F|nr:hypothetical protein [Phenylobacterium sp.]MDP3853530.1 hypothetical protein [Phenylobacterium sp.]